MLDDVKRVTSPQQSGQFDIVARAVLKLQLVERSIEWNKSVQRSRNHLSIQDY
jgi:hypothetical protein